MLDFCFKFSYFYNFTLRYVIMLGYTHNKATSSVLNLMLLHLRRHALTGQDVCCNSRNNKELIGAAAEAAAASLFR